MVSLHRFAIGLILFLAPLAASAKRETVFNFQQSIPGLWEKGPCLVAQQSPEGLALTTGAERCQIFHVTSDLRHSVETLTLTALSPARTEIILLWHRLDAPRGHMVELPLVLPADITPQTLSVNPSRYPQWDPRTDRIGFVIQKNSSIVLQSLTLTQWSVWDKALAALWSFWTFDTFRPYAINFLWGPVIGWNPIWQEQLFTSIPPPGWSASRMTLAILFCTAVLCWAWCARQQWRAATCRLASILFGSVATGLWLLFDARMGLELLSYVRTDWETFLLRPPAERHFRVFERFPFIAEESVPILTRSPQYGFVGPQGAPFGSLLRYYTYPVRPIFPGDSEEERARARHWLVAYRDDARIGPEGKLFLGDTFLAGPGTVVQRFDNDAYIFEVTSPTTSQ